MNRMISRTIAAAALTLFAMSAARAESHDNTTEIQFVSSAVTGDETVEARENGRRSRHAEGRNRSERHGERHAESHRGRNRH